MTDWFAEALEPTPPRAAPAASPPRAAPAASPPAAGQDWLRAALGDGSAIGVQPPGTRMGPPIDDMSRAASYRATGSASLLPNVDDQITAYSRQMGIPRERFGVDSSGNIVYADRDGRLARVNPSVSGATGVGDAARRAAGWLAGQAGPAIPMAGGTAGGAVGEAVAGPAGGIFGATAGSGLFDYLRQVAGRYINGLDESPLGNLTNVDPLNVAGQAAMGGAGQTIGTGLRAAFNRNPLGVSAFDRVQATTPAAQAAWERLYASAARSGVDLDVAQTTGLPSLRVAGRQLRRYPETMDAETARLEQQQTVQIPDAMRRQMDANVGPARSVDEAVGNNPEFAPRDLAGNALPRPGLRGAAGDIIEGAGRARTALASPHYQEAFGSGTIPDASPIVQRIDDLLQSGRFPENSATARALGAARTSLTREVTDAQGNVTRTVLDNYEGLHNAKLAMDSALGELARSGASRADLRVAERNLVALQQDLTNTLRRAHPAYERGYQAYIAASPAVQAVERDLGALANMDGPERMAVLDATFGARNMTPERVTRMRQAFLTTGRIEEWNGAVRAWMDNRLADAVTPLQDGQVPNVAGRLFKTLTEGRQRDILRAALPPDAARNLEAFFEVLDAARRFAPEGSPTATDLGGMGAEVTGRAVRNFGRALSPSTVLEAGNIAAETINAMRTPAMRVRFAEAFSDPQALRTLGNLRMLSPTSEQAMRIASRFVTNYVGTTGAGWITGGPGERAPQSSGPMN